MSPDAIKDGLRLAVVNKLLWGWYVVDARGYNEWILNSNYGPVVTLDDEGVTKYVEMVNKEYGQ